MHTAITLAKKNSFHCQFLVTSLVLLHSQEKLMQHVGAGLQATQIVTRMRPPDPDAAPAIVIHAAPGSEAAAKDLLFKLDSMHSQVCSPCLA